VTKNKYNIKQQQQNCSHSTTHTAITLPGQHPTFHWVDHII